MRWTAGTRKLVMNQRGRTSLKRMEGCRGAQLPTDPWIGSINIYSGGCRGAAAPALPWEGSGEWPERCPITLGLDFVAHGHWLTATGVVAW